jgi:hypothetical protein
MDRRNQDQKFTLQAHDDYRLCTSEALYSINLKIYVVVCADDLKDFQGEYSRLTQISSSFLSLSTQHFDSLLSFSNSDQVHSHLYSYISIVSYVELQYTEIYATIFSALFVILLLSACHI